MAIVDGMLVAEDDEHDVFGPSTSNRRSRRLSSMSAHSTRRTATAGPSRLSVSHTARLSAQGNEGDVMSAPSIYEGEFNVYSISDSSLNRPAPGLLRRMLSSLSLTSDPAIAESPDYAALYRKIRTLDGDSGAFGSDLRAHLSLDPSRWQKVGQDNMFWVLGDPNYDAYLMDVRDVVDIVLASGARCSGIAAKLAMPEDRVGVDAWDGDVNLARVWAGPVDVETTGDDGEVGELFEGRFRLKAEYSVEAWREGYGEGADTDFAFWAVRTTE